MDGVPARPSLPRPKWLRLRAEGDEIRHLLGTGGGRVLVGTVGAVCALTLVGLLALWPYGWETACRTIVVSVEGRDVPLNLQRVRNAPAALCSESSLAACRAAIPL